MIIPIGYDPVFRDDPLHYARIDSEKHQLVVGKSGAGKSTLLGREFIALIDSGLGGAVIDPHGDMAVTVASNIPADRIGQVLYFSPMRKAKISLNPFENKRPSKEVEDFKVAAEAIYTDRATGRSGWGDRTADIFTYFCKAAYDIAYEYPTLEVVQRMMRDTSWRRSRLHKIKDPDVRNWFRWYEAEDKESGWTPRMRLDATAAPMNKVNGLLSDVLRPILCQPGAFNFREAIEKKMILIFDLAIGDIGTNDCALLGSLIVSKLTKALLSRKDLPPKRRHDFPIIIDEFLSFFACTDVSAALLQTRKYGGRWTLGTQTYFALPEDIQASIIGGCETLVWFRVGAKDAKLGAEEIGDQYPASRLQKLNRSEFVLSTVLEGIVQREHLYHAFSPLETGSMKPTFDAVLRTSDSNFGRRRAA